MGPVLLEVLVSSDWALNQQPVTLLLEVFAAAAAADGCLVCRHTPIQAWLFLSWPYWKSVQRELSTEIRY